MENRLKLFYDAGSRLFINKGFTRTQNKDLAKAIGLSAGMVYQYFVSKKDILNFILKCTIDPTFMDDDLEYPINPELFCSLDDDIAKNFTYTQEQFGVHLKDGAAGYELKDMISDAFDLIAKYGVGCLIIENNADALQELHKFYQRYRRQFFLQIRSYVEIYIANGTFRKVDDVFYTARAIVEILAWWGMHIIYDAYEQDLNITIEKAKSICLDNLLHAYGK